MTFFGLLSNVEWWHSLNKIYIIIIIIIIIRVMLKILAKIKAKINQILPN